MQKRKRLINILIAGTLSIFILVIFLAFRGGNSGDVESDATEQTTTVELVGKYEADMVALQARIDSLQAQNEELRAAVSRMQAREVEYQNQIEIANQTIDELSDQASSITAGRDGLGAFSPRPEGRSR